MRIACLITFSLGILLGVAGFAWFQIGGIAPPAPQETTRIEVSISHLKPEDQWLDKVHFQIVPLADVKSLHQYFIILMIPPTGGIQASENAKALLNLTSSTDSTIQPFDISRKDFGMKGDQPVLKFIDNGNPLGNTNQKFAVSSSLF